MPPTELAIARALNKRLPERKLTVSVAEGSSGGRIGERLVRYPGATAYFKGAIVTYDYPSRSTLLGIPQDELRAHGSVSEWSARIMAERVRESFGTDLGLASTGVTGPRGTDIGLLWLAIADGKQTHVEDHRLSQRSRIAMQAAFTELALSFLLRIAN